MDADTGNVFLSAQFSEIGRKTLLNRMIAFVDNEGNDTGKIAAAFQKVFQFVVQVFGILCRFTGADDDQVSGRLHFFGQPAVQQPRRQIGLVQEDWTAPTPKMGMLLVGFCRKAVKLEISFKPAGPAFIIVFIADKGKIGIGV